MASKSLLFLSLFLVGVAVPMAQAQLGGLGGLLGLINISGTVFCTANGNMGTNGQATPAFSNALVQLQCGASKTVVSSATTNGSGVFSILLDPITMLLSSLLNNCNLVVNTPLSSCNSALPSTGILQSPLQFVTRTLAGLLSIVNLGAGGFNFLPGVL
ncbi:phylloplanin-like [Tasmannia lanceolata]|uniref:phylloplanin-like n=1 Tax=Tasmannia lanceolata TaxID=3420 RepID=UPI0040627FFD